MLPAFLLVVIGLTTPNPTAVAQENLVDRAPLGIVRITRHPFLMGTALWAAIHLVGNGDEASFLFFSALLIVSVAGTVSIDAKRARSLGASAWSGFARRTSIVPFAAILAGRNTLSLAELGWWRPAAGVAAYALMLGGPVLSRRQGAKVFWFSSKKNSLLSWEPAMRALISVSDKSGLIAFAQGLAALGVEILSTGGSAAALRQAGLDVIEVSAHTGFPEILDGRVKTLVPQIHGGILGRRDEPAHLAQMAAHGIAPIDLVAVNLYPFEATVAGGGAWDDCIANIDIGGPALIRAAAKNHDFVSVLTDPEQYGPPRGLTRVRRGVCAHGRL